MGNARQKKIENALEVFGEAPDRSSDRLKVAICLTVLKKYSSARRLYGLALGGLLNDRFWHKTSQPNWLADTFIMANEAELYPQVFREIEDYKVDPRGDSPVAQYSYALLCLKSRNFENIETHVFELLRKPKVKYAFAMGKTIKAIIEADQEDFDTALDDLLRTHRGMAKFGGLRETPEGFLCLPAMSLSKMALERDLELNAESEYLSRGYLEYIQASQVA